MRETVKYIEIDVKVIFEKLKSIIRIKLKLPRLSDRGLGKELNIKDIGKRIERNSIPYKEIITYCINNEIPPNAIFSDEQFKLMVDI